jgi:hypothetical protein
MVENAFGIFENQFKECLHKSNLLVTFIFDVFTCCILKKHLRNEDEANIENFFYIIES